MNRSKLYTALDKIAREDKEKYKEVMVKITSLSNFEKELQKFDSPEDFIKSL